MFFFHALYSTVSKLFFLNLFGLRMVYILYFSAKSWWIHVYLLLWINQAHKFQGYKMIFLHCRWHNIWYQVGWVSLFLIFLVLVKWLLVRCKQTQSIFKQTLICYFYKLKGTCTANIKLFFALQSENWFKDKMYYT